MSKHAENVNEKKNQSVANANNSSLIAGEYYIPQEEEGKESEDASQQSHFSNSSAKTIQLQEIQELANQSDQVKAGKATQVMVNNSARVKQLKEMHDMVASSPHALQAAEWQKEANNKNSEQKSVNHKKASSTGLPNHIKAGAEKLSGFSMDDVNVHYNSPKPVEFKAHAYAQGTDIHLAAGQEKHLPHEVWHIVQQKQGRVQATNQTESKEMINDDASLEKEADIMGAKLLKSVNDDGTHDDSKNELKSGDSKQIIQTIQLYKEVNLNGSLDEDSYNQRADSESKGHNSFGSNNVARAVIISELEIETTIFAQSQHGKVHSEEALISKIIEEFGEKILKQDPSIKNQNRIKEIYTERAPCSNKNADSSRKKRKETNSNCNDFLANKIHKDIPVKFSVPNDVSGHNKLMEVAKNRYYMEIVDDKRRMTYENAKNRGFYYFVPIRRLCNEKYKSNQYGRNYFDEAKKVTEYIDRFDASVKAFGLMMDIKTPLIKAFESVAHYVPNIDEYEVVCKRIDETAKSIKVKIDLEIADIYAMFSDSDEDLDHEKIKPDLTRAREKELVNPNPVKKNKNNPKEDSE